MEACCRQTETQDQLLDFRHKKRRLWTSLDDEVVGRGNLNPIIKILIYNINIGFSF
jgi:hypothetical protein